MKLHGIPCIKGVALSLLLALLLWGCTTVPTDKNPNYVQQEMLFDCGSAAGAMLVNFAGGYSTAQQAKHTIGKAEWWTGSDIVKLLSLHGRRFSVYSNISEGLASQQFSALIIRVLGFNHWVVVQWQGNGLVHVLDPSGLSGGEYWWSLEQLEHYRHKNSLIISVKTAP